MRRFQKRMLRHEHRRDHRRGSDRREVGRTPVWVIGDRRNRRRRDEETGENAVTDVRLEVSGTDGLRGRWLHEPETGWDVAPTWAREALDEVWLLVSEGRWAHPYPVEEPLSGHVVHCDGLWDGDELVCEPERETYYVATVNRSDGTRDTLSLWRDANEREERA